ncbi:MAG: flagellar biosynthetic protein FliR [Vulcanimicrobiaceae bacterium]
MPDVFGLTGAQFETFILIFVRVASMLALYPVFGAAQIPVMVRTGLAMVITFLLYHVVPTAPVSDSIYALAAAVVSQVVLGVIVGFLAQLVFVAVQFAGEVLDLQVGFAVANVINPQTQQQITILGELELTLATLIFLITNSQLLLIQGIAGSFHLVPLPYVHLHFRVASDVVAFFSRALLEVLRIAAPAGVTLFITNVVLAFMARVAPQMNVFVVGLPLQVGVGLIMLGFSVPLIGAIVPEVAQESIRQMSAVMRSMR